MAETTELVPSQRKRASKTKIRTGCNNCKIRRVKCDGARPTCLKCQKTGRSCDGYSTAYLPADKAVIAADASRLPLGWWQCEECYREVNTTFWEYTCPDCGFTNEAGRAKFQLQTQALKSGEATVTINPVDAEQPETDADAVIGTQRGDPVASSISELHEQEEPEKRGSFRFRVCHVVICIGILTFVGSLTLALWWSMVKNDVSGGFTMAAYVVAVGGLPLASIQIRHNQRCRCWKNSREAGRGVLDHD